MSKNRKKRTRKSTKPATLATPRLQAIDKLLERQCYEQALRKIDAALQADSRHGGLFQRRIEALTELQRDTHAEMTAYQWTRARPNSSQAWYALYVLSLENQRPMLSMDAARHFNTLAESTGETPIPVVSDAEIEAGTMNPFTGARVDSSDLLLMDLGHLCVETAHFEEGVERRVIRAQ